MLFPLSCRCGSCPLLQARGYLCLYHACRVIFTLDDFQAKSENFKGSNALQHLLQLAENPSVVLRSVHVYALPVLKITKKSAALLHLLATSKTTTHSSQGATEEFHRPEYWLSRAAVLRITSCTRSPAVRWV